MLRLFINQQTDTNNSLSSFIDIYEDGILRTFASLKASSSTELLTFRRYHHSNCFSLTGK